MRHRQERTATRMMTSTRNSRTPTITATRTTLELGDVGDDVVVVTGSSLADDRLSTVIDRF